MSPFISYWLDADGSWRRCCFVSPCHNSDLSTIKQTIVSSLFLSDPCLHLKAALIYHTETLVTVTSVWPHPEPRAKEKDLQTKSSVSLLEFMQHMWSKLNAETFQSCDFWYHRCSDVFAHFFSSPLLRLHNTAAWPPSIPSVRQRER